jgi:hypothetical protein
MRDTQTENGRSPKAFQGAKSRVSCLYNGRVPQAAKASAEHSVQGSGAVSEAALCDAHLAPSAVLAIIGVRLAEMRLEGDRIAGQRFVAAVGRRVFK